MISSVQRNIIYNTNMIKKGEIKDYSDLLKPQYKGKITLNDPTVMGAGADMMVHLTLNIWNPDQTRKFLQQLIVQQQTFVERDRRIHMESVARGKFAIGLGPNTESLATLLQAGAPLDAVILKYGVRVTSAAGAFSVPIKPAHPNAAKLFANWLLTKEGQTVFSKGFGNPSLRTDVTTEGFNPLFIVQPQEKVFPDSEDFLLHTGGVVKMAKQVIDGAGK